ncbi:MAG TPA: hypothetical protein VN714_16885, partial [Trebonia sp.]|nr:hypothetical protein [Trebonia sp.]
MPGSIRRLRGHAMVELTPGWPGPASRREGFWRVSHGWSCPGNIGCVTWRQRGARRASGGRNIIVTKREAGEAVRAAKARLGVTWAQLA